MSQKSCLRTCALSEDSYQFAHLRRLIRIFTERILDSQGRKFSLCRQRRLLSDCADAQADLSLRWAHMSEGTFSDVAFQIMYHAAVYCCTKGFVLLRSIPPVILLLTSHGWPTGRAIGYKSLLGDVYAPFGAQI